MVTAKKTASKNSNVKQDAASTSAADDDNNNKRLGMPSLDDLKEMLEKVKVPGLDVAAIVEAQRKDMEALADANRKSFEGMQALAQRRNKMLKEALQNWQSTAKDAAGGEMLSKGAEQAKQGVQKALENFRELAEMEAQSRRDAWKLLQDRFEQNVAGLRSLLQPKSDK